MADLTIDQLTAGNPAQSGDELPIQRGGSNFKVTAGSIVSLMGSSPAGSNVLMIQEPINASGFDGAATDCIIVRIPASSITAVGTKVKVTVQFLAGNGTFTLTPVIRRTLPNDATFTDTTPLTFGGLASPVFTTSSSASNIFTSDAISVPIDTQHDMYFIFRETSVPGGVGFNVMRLDVITRCSGETINGVDYSTVNPIPNLTTLLGLLSKQCCLITNIAIAVA